MLTKNKYFWIVKNRFVKEFDYDFSLRLSPLFTAFLAAELGIPQEENVTTVKEITEV